MARVGLPATLNFVLTRDDAVLPSKAHPEDVGYDVTVTHLVKQLTPRVALYGTGLKASITPGYHYELYERSSMCKTGYSLANKVGIIENTYRGEIFVALRHEEDLGPLQLPARLVQLVVRKSIDDVEVVQVQELTETDRGEGGFGSTGK